MPDQTDFETRAANILKAELKRHGVTYAQLVTKLDAIGVSEKEVNIRNKLSRGKFSAAFMLACLEAVGSRDLRLI
ncbi:DUF6471 domain-containing protein [Maricaulis sp.]|uniref:DUF6471 domain-containing protein n=1 Tax=Maricaulis sp. TaxID=1486257 RepID=UPI003A8DF0B9